MCTGAGPGLVATGPMLVESGPILADADRVQAKLGRIRDMLGRSWAKNPGRSWWEVAEFGSTSAEIGRRLADPRPKLSRVRRTSTGFGATSRPYSRP